MNIRIVISVLFGTIVLILFAFAKEDSHAEIEANKIFVETVPIIVFDLIWIMVLQDLLKFFTSTPSGWIVLSLWIQKDLVIWDNWYISREVRVVLSQFDATEAVYSLHAAWDTWETSTTLICKKMDKACCPTNFLIQMHKYMHGLTQWYG